MASTNGNTPPSLDGITTQLREALTGVTERENELKFQLDSVSGERRKLEKMLELATGVTQKRAKARAKRHPGQSVSPAGAAEYFANAKEELIDYIQEHAFEREPGVPDSFVMKDLRNIKGSLQPGDFPYGTDLIKRAIEELRAEGKLRLLGQRQLDKDIGINKPSAVYALVNAQDQGKVLVGADVSNG